MHWPVSAKQRSPAWADALIGTTPPISGSNWEGTGVVPDVAVPAAGALDAALRAARKR